MDERKIATGAMQFLLNDLKKRECQGFSENEVDVPTVASCYLNDLNRVVRVALWNKEKQEISWDRSFDTYAEVAAYEEGHGSLSSEITCRTRDVEDIVAAIEAETDVTITYEILQG